MYVTISVRSAHSKFSHDCLTHKLLKYNLFVRCGLPVFNTFLAAKVHFQNFMPLIWEEDVLETV